MIIVKDYADLTGQKAEFCGKDSVLVKLTSRAGVVLTEEEKEAQIKEEIDGIFEKSDKKEVTFETTKTKEKIIQLEVLGGIDAKYIVTRPLAVSILAKYGADEVGIVAKDACMFIIK